MPNQADSRKIGPDVLVERAERMMAIILNRPREINALTTEMIQLIRQALDEARTEDRFQFVLFLGEGEKGFCAGGDIKALAHAVKEGDFPQAERFFQEEYDLDLSIHRYQKPVVLLADGITMGGGLGLAAGADIVVATEKSVMAMPETRIGFFPDVGATAWLFSKCPPGYPEFLGLTGHEMKGAECLRLGLANVFSVRRLQELKEALTHYSGMLTPSNRRQGVEQLRSYINPFVEKIDAPDPEMDAWVAGYFSGKNSIDEIMISLSQCREAKQSCEEGYHRMKEYSPTALALTLRLLRHNQGRPLEEVFPIEEKAAAFMIRHPDYLEGIRAYLLDKDKNPHWQPPTLMGLSSVEFDLG